MPWRSSGWQPDYISGASIWPRADIFLPTLLPTRLLSAADLTVSSARKSPRRVTNREHQRAQALRGATRTPARRADARCPPCTTAPPSTTHARTETDTCRNDGRGLQGGVSMPGKRTVRFMAPALAALGVSVLLHAQGGATMPARQGQAVVTLSNGRVLVTGGLDGQLPTSD